MAGFVRLQRGEKRQNKGKRCRISTRIPNGSSCTCSQFSVRSITAALAQKHHAERDVENLGQGPEGRRPEQTPEGSRCSQEMWWAGKCPPKDINTLVSGPHECHLTRHRTLQT